MGKCSKERANCTCKGPEAGTRLICSGNRKPVCLGRREQGKRGRNLWWKMRSEPYAGLDATEVVSMLF